MEIELLLNVTVVFIVLLCHSERSEESEYICFVVRFSYFLLMAIIQ